jgi:lysophospholipase L1-like esterase
VKKVLAAIAVLACLSVLVFGWKQTKEIHQLRRDNKDLLQYMEISRNGTKYTSLNAALAQSDTARVIFFGDSIMERWGWYGPFFPGHHYINRGISGQTSSEMLVRFHQDVLDLHPALVIIDSGTNDVGFGISSLETKANIESMVELAKANHIRVLLTSITPMEHFLQDTTVKTAAKVKALNAWIRKYCAEQGIGYVDYDPVLAGTDGGMRDGLSFEGTHPNAAGYASMAPVVQAAIDKELK